jgi:hypothetical protein
MKQRTTSSAARTGEPEKTNPEPRTYDPRKECEKRAREERKGMDAEFGDRRRTSEDGSNAGDSQRGDYSNQGGLQWRRDPREARKDK